ncbi:MAG: T9SS type A sorting domain-containing protein, partial [Bacteroidota bacterium]
NAQSFSFVDSKIQNIAPTCAGTNEYYVHLRNEKADSLTMQWKAIYDSLQYCWNNNYSVCDNYNCYLGIPAAPQTMTKIGVGDTCYLKFTNSFMSHFSGTPTAKILVWDMDIPANFDTVVFHFTICPDSAQCNYAYPEGIKLTEQNHEFHLFPNPANAEISFTVTVKQDAFAHFYDLSGKEIIRIPVITGKNKMNIAWLENGIYFIKVFEGSKLIGIEKFVKN